MNESLSVDGVMQAPGAPDEDRSGGFEHGGWAMPYFDDTMGEMASEGMGSSDGLLLGRKTYEIFAAYWPNQPDDVPFAAFLNNIPKYVASTTLKEPLEWANSNLIKGDVAEEVQGRAGRRSPCPRRRRPCPNSDGAQPGRRIPAVDPPDRPGNRKRLFRDGSPSTPLRLVESKTSSTGVLLLSYRVGEKE